MTAPLTLILFAVVTATLGRRLLSDSAWADRSPWVGILAWQALTASVVVAAVLVGITLALPAVPLSTDLAVWLTACAEALTDHYATPGGLALSIAGALMAVAITARIGYCFARELLTATWERRRRSQVLDATARTHEGSTALVITNDVPAAYCLPGRHRKVVLTTAAVAALNEDELAAVLAHEQAHLHGRHHLILAAATALRRAFPFVPVFRDAHDALGRLVEMLADDVAAKQENRLAVARALVHLAEASAPVAALGAGGSTALIRVRRLVAPPQPLGAARAGIAALAAAALLAAPIAVAVSPAVHAATVDLCPVDLPGGVL